MVKIPERINLANLPTRIEKLSRLSEELAGPNIYIKRDDQTGSEMSGNKVRKLEYAVKEALNQGCDTLITCGGIQSNHARATAAVAARLGINSCLLLKSDETPDVDGNYFLDKVLGADIRFASSDDFSERRMEIMEEIKEDLAKEGKKGYVIPVGASNGIGTFGYYNAMDEIKKQEEELGINFDAIVISVGSGGTYAGLFLASKIKGYKTKIYGVNVCDDEEYFVNQVDTVLKESLEYIDAELEYSKEEINILDGYVGEGYALSRPEEIEFIHDLARKEGIILDPVYTGKGMYGLVNEIKKGTFKDCKNILFIHTGGLFGLFPKKDLFWFGS